MQPDPTDSDAADDDDHEDEGRRPDEHHPDRGVPGFDPDAPGNFVDDTDSPSVPEPNEPA